MNKTENETCSKVLKKVCKNSDDNFKKICKPCGYEKTTPKKAKTRKKCNPTLYKICKQSMSQKYKDTYCNPCFGEMEKPCTDFKKKDDCHSDKVKDANNLRRCYWDYKKDGGKCIEITDENRRKLVTEIIGFITEDDINLRTSCKRHSSRAACQNDKDYVNQLSNCSWNQKDQKCEDLNETNLRKKFFNEFGG